MTSFNSILDMLKQKTQRQADESSTFDITLGSPDEYPALDYSSFIDTMLSCIKRQRPDVKELFSAWGKIQLIPFYSFYADGNQYKLGTSDLVLLADKLHINVIMPRYVVSGDKDNSSYDTILHLSKLRDLKLEISIGHSQAKKIHAIVLSYKNASDLADIIVRDFISPNYPYPDNTFFKPMDFYSFIKSYVSRSFSPHIIQLGSESWQFKAYPSARLVQKVLTIDFLGGNSEFNRFVTHRSILEYEPILHNPRSRLLATKAGDPQRLPYTPQSIITIHHIIKAEFLDKSPILDDSADLIYLENLVIEKNTDPAANTKLIDARIKGRMMDCLFFTADEI
jgi:hypothetical protein